MHGAHACNRDSENTGRLTRCDQNISPLAATPDEKLLIGFRNPIPGGRALLLPLQNPIEVVREWKPVQFGTPIELDLKGLGIRVLGPIRK
jgi:hypothetical protein